jgi:ribosome-associated protein
MQRKERNLPRPALSRAGARRAAEPISKMRPDAEEILRLVLTGLDDMKAEDTVTIDLAGKSTIADTMVVTSGRSSRHVGSVACATRGSKACRTATGC